MSPGGVFRLFNVHSSAYGQLSAKSRWPALEEEWLQAKSYSFRGPADVGFTSNNRSSFPEAVAPFLLEMEHAEVRINFPSLLSRPATVKQHVTKRGRPPPPPQAPDGSWGFGKGRADWAPQTRATAEEIMEPGERSALQEFTGFDLIGAFQGPL